MEALNIKIIKITDVEYPHRLLNVKTPPKKIYVEGDYTLLSKNSIAIVGSRDCTQYGKKYAFDFAKELSKNNICVVSGLAMGIDAEAHLGALSQKGSTIAVIGSGFEHIFPEEHTNLYNQIIRCGGCIVSEYEPSRKADLTTFPQRNRIISGLAMGTLVVEAGYRSGSSITAKYTIEAQKPLFCIPSNIDSKQGVGTNRLLKQGAILITSPEDILDFYILPEEQEKEIEMPEQYQKIYRYLQYEPININEISRKVNINMQELNSILSLMEIDGYVKSMPGNSICKC